MLVLAKRITFLLLLTALAGLEYQCPLGAMPTVLESLSTAAPDRVPPKLRLGRAVKPTRYAVTLTLIPGEDLFAGTVTISLDLSEATEILWLNATELTVQKAELQLGGQSLPAQPVVEKEDFLGLAFERTVGPGTGTLRITYQGQLFKKDSRGLFTQKEGDQWYVFSQFEPTDARLAFPCFDEPSFKTPWQLTLRVKKEHVALANTSVVAEYIDPSGMKIVKFGETKPLPSYLVALAVGPFESVDAGRAGKKGTPIRIITPHGRSNEAYYPAQVTAEILTRLEDYFGTPYPFDKLDSIAVPQFGGAMENPGLVTYSLRGILTKPEEETIRYRRGYAGTCAHELAHMWFGDLVTTAWWNDLWLNEAFATWMSEKIIDQWKPDWDGKVNRVFSRQGAMGGDRLITARKIRQPIESKHDIANAFDGITYGKGAAILAMFETWIGANKFQKGVQRYLDKYAWGNATAGDFLAALSAEAGRDVAPAFATFLDQAGVPFVTAELHCAQGASPRLALTQQRYLPVGSQGSAQQTWQIPICIRYSADGRAERVCMMMSERTAEITLASTKDCPDWVLPNEEATGYYRILYKGDLLTRLLRAGGQRLTLPERLGVIGDVRALTQSGEMPMGSALALVPALLKDANPHIISSAIGLSALNDHLVSEELRPNYARFIRQMYGEKAKALGWKSKPEEEEDTRLLRPGLLGLVAADGEDKALIREADQLARRWLEDHRAIDPDLVDTVLRIAARFGNRELFDRFHAAAKKARDSRERTRLLGAMGAFRDVEITKTALAIALTDEFEPREATSLIFGARGGSPKTRDLTYTFVKQNFDALVAKLPRDSGATLAFSGGGFCDEAHRADVEAFFKSRSTTYTGGPRILAQVLEQIRLCSAVKNVQQPSVSAFLKKY